MQADLQSILILAATVLAGSAFLVTGMRMHANIDMVAGILAAKGIPYPRFVAMSGAAIEVVLGGLMIVGVWLPAISIALAVFVLAATAMVHDFWRQTGQQRETDLGIAIANLIMVGGLLGLAAATL